MSNDTLDLDMTPSIVSATDTSEAPIVLDMDPAPAMDPADDSASEAPALVGEAPATLASDLATIAESSAVVGPIASGSLAEGSLAYVGFNSASGYVTALAHGVKAATAESYKQTLRQRYSYTNEQIAALVVTLIPEGTDRAISQNPEIVTHDGPNVFEARRLARGMSATSRLPTPVIVRPAIATPTSEAPATVVAAITPGTLIANLLQDKNGKIFGAGRADRRATHRTRTEIVAALASIGRTDLAPTIKTSKAQFGEVMRSLNAPGTRMRAWNVTRRDVQKAGQEWPEDLASRWCVGVLDGTDALGSLGEKVLIADLLETNEIRFYGGSDTLHQKVSDAFTARVGEQMYNATDLLNWFRRKMQESFHMVQWASFMFVPGNAEQTGTVCAFVNAVRPVLSRSIGEIDAVTGQGLINGLAEGLLDEIQEIQDDFQDAQDRASERERAKELKRNPQATAADLDLAARRAKVLPGAASTFVRRLNDKADRVNGYETMLGTEAVAPVRALIASLRATVEPLCDDTSAMAANIELD